MNSKNRSKVSVIIPLYNQKQYVGEAIGSILNQTYPNIEIIVVNDGSTDNPFSVLEKYKKNIILINQENKGLAAVRNTGLKNCSGEYIQFLDADDEWLPEKLEKQLIKFQNSSERVSVIYNGFFYVSEKSGKIVSEIMPTLRGNVYTNLLESCILGSPTPLIKKRCFRKSGFFDETLPSRQDWDMWIRLSKYYNFDFVPDILAKHYVHGSQVSVDLNAKIVAREKLIEKYWVDLSQYPQTLSVLLYRLGVLYCLDEDPRRGRKYFLDSIKQKPLQKGAYIHFLLSLLVPGIHRNVLKKHSITNIDGITFYY